MKNSIQYQMLGLLWLILGGVTDLRGGSDLLVIMAGILGIISFGIAIYTSFKGD